jgi:hypothetical protein
MSAGRRRNLLKNWAPAGSFNITAPSYLGDWSNTMRHTVTILAILSYFLSVGPVPGKQSEEQDSAKNMEKPQVDSSPHRPQGTDFAECIKHNSAQCRQTFAMAMERSFRQRFPDGAINAEDANKESFVYTSATLFSSSERRLANWKAIHADFRENLCGLGFQRVVMRKYKESVAADQDEYSLDCSLAAPGRKTKAAAKMPDANLLSEAKSHVSSSYEATQKVTRYQPTQVSSYNEGGQKIEIFPYLEKGDNGRARLRLKGVVNGADRLSVVRAKAVVDGSAMTIELDPAAQSNSKILEGRDSNSGATVQETIDFENPKDFIQRVARAKDVYISFEGKMRAVEFHLHPSDVQNFIWIIALYEGESTP